MNIQTMTTPQLQHTLQLAYKALGLLNKLKDSLYKTVTKSHLFRNINALKAKLKGSTPLAVKRYTDICNSSKVWLVKRSKHGHYFLNQEVDGVILNSRYKRTTLKHIKQLGIQL